MIVALCELINPQDIIKHANAKQHCTFKVGGELEYLVCPKTLNSFCKYLSILSANKVAYKVVGNMSNILPDDGLNKGVYITTKYITEPPKVFGNTVNVVCGFMLPALCKITAMNGLSGLECLAGIPATIGGAVVNNAGAFGQSISDTLESVLVYKNGKVNNLQACQLQMGYRTSRFKQSKEIVLSATFKLSSETPAKVQQQMLQTIQKRQSLQPQLPSAGSVFKKHQNTSAGQLIDNAKLKGATIGGAQVSTKHAGFIVNVGNATCTDVKQLITMVETIIKKQFNINLTREIEFLGEVNEH